MRWHFIRVCSLLPSAVILSPSVPHYSGCLLQGRLADASGRKFVPADADDRQEDSDPEDRAPATWSADEDDHGALHQEQAAAEQVGSLAQSYSLTKTQQSHDER